MSTPYRDVPRADDNEPIPNLSVRLNLWIDVFAYVAIVAVGALAALRENVHLATVFVILSLPGLLVMVLLAVLYEPLGRWCAARRASAVTRGVAALEAKVSARE